MSADQNTRRELLNEAIILLKYEKKIISDKDIARDTGFKAPTISQMKSGARDVTDSFAKVFLEAYGLDITGKKLIRKESMKRTESKVIKLLLLIAEKMKIPDVDIRKALK